MSGSTSGGKGEEELEAAEAVDVVEAECLRTRMGLRGGCVLRVGMREAETGDEVVMLEGNWESQRRSQAVALAIRSLSSPVWQVAKLHNQHRTGMVLLWSNGAQRMPVDRSREGGRGTGHKRHNFETRLALAAALGTARLCV